MLDLPDLQSPSTENTSPLVLGQVSGGDTDFVWLTFALLLGRCGRGLTVSHLLVATGITIAFVLLGGIPFLIHTRLFTFLVVSCQEVVSFIALFANKSIRWTRRGCIRVTNKGVLCKASVQFRIIASKPVTCRRTSDHRSRSRPHRRRRRTRRRT